MKILVVGATGVLGRSVVRRLLAAGVAVRALARTPKHAAGLANQGAEVVEGDLVDAGSLERACAGTDRVLAAAHSLLGRGRYRSDRVDGAGHRALIDAARAAGVERFVYTSAANASHDHPVDFFRTKAAIEDYLRTSGIAHVILRPTAFMEHHVHEFNGKSVLATGRARLIGTGEKKRNFVAADDVAQYAVVALTAEPMPSQPIEIGGPANLTNREIAELYARTAGVPLRISRMPAPVARSRREAATRLAPTPLRDVWSWFRERTPVVSRHREEVGPTVVGSPSKGCGGRCAVCRAGSVTGSWFIRSCGAWAPESCSCYSALLSIWHRSWSSLPEPPSVC